MSHQKIFRFFIILSSILLFCFSACNVQKQLTTPTNKEVIIEDEKMLLGKIDAEGLQLEEYSNWFNSTYESYSFKPEPVEELNAYLKGIHIKAFIGTWCSDSQRDVPAFYKILDSTDFKKNRLEMIAIDRSKQQPSDALQGHDIAYVPTFIFYRDNIEIGRIVETPSLSLEEDMLAIIKK